MSKPGSRIVHKTCNLCEAMCGLRIEVRGREIGRIEGDPDDPLSRGAICPKAIALKEIHEDPDRLKRPLRRRLPRTSREAAAGAGEGVERAELEDAWEEIAWDEALQLAAERFAEIQRRHGPDAVALYIGNPSAHNLGILLGLVPLGAALGTRSRYSASSLDQNPKHASSILLFHHWLRIPIPDVDRTHFLLVLGANPVVSGGSLMSAPGFRKRIEALRARGGRLVVVDPRRSETARLADQHLFVPPGSDGLLLAALIHTVLDEKLGRENAAGRRCDHRAELADALTPFAPERVADRLRLEAREIRALARDFAAAPSAVCYGRVGTSQHPYGTLCSWLADVLTLLTGNLDRPGGALFPAPAVDLAALSPESGLEAFDEGRTRVRGAPRFHGEAPTACLAEEIATPGPGQVRGLLTVAGNPALSAPNGRALERALGDLDFLVAVDFYVNETTRHADLILPPSTSLEHDNYELLFHGFAVRNTVKLSPTVVAPEPGQREDMAILVELALRLAEAKAGSAWRRAGWRLLRALPLPGPRRLLSLALRLGPRGDGFRPWRSGISLADLEAAPSGLDLGPLEPRLDTMLRPPRDRIDLLPSPIGAELERLATELVEPREESPLVLIGRREVRTCNSWLHNTRVGTKGRERCTLQMHPADAAARGLVAGRRVRIRSRVGDVEAPLELSEDLLRGVVSLPHGWGHRGPGMRMRLAEAHPGVSCNELVDDAVLEPVVGNALFNGVPVEVSPVG